MNLCQNSAVFLVNIYCSVISSQDSVVIYEEDYRPASHLMLFSPACTALHVFMKIKTRLTIWSANDL